MENRNMKKKKEDEAKPCENEKPEETKEKTMKRMMNMVNETSDSLIFYQ